MYWLKSVAPEETELAVFDVVLGKGSKAWMARAWGERRLVGIVLLAKGVLVNGSTIVLDPKLPERCAVCGDDRVENEALAKTLAFEVEEEEGAVATGVEVRDGERVTEVCAELVALEDLTGGGEVVAGVELIVANELEDAAMKAVGAAFDGGVEKGAAAVLLGRIGALLDRELLEGVDRGLDERAALVLLADVDAVEKKADRGPADAGDDIAVDDLGTHGERVAGRGKEGGARGQLGEAKEAAAIER